ncbi:MAG: zinc-ribbon domain-containing protein [Candidatus Bathyarchaeia archaeon]
MFCPSCGKQNQDNVVFCAHCGKALPQKSTSPHTIQLIPPANSSPQKTEKSKARLSSTAIKAIITGVLIVALVIIVLLIYYPGLLPWNW